MKMFPPVREQTDREGLWSAMSAGVITSLSSDHAPHTVAEKSTPLSDQPGGSIGVETLLPVMLTAMARGRVTPERLSWLLSEGTARLYGVYPRKGAIQPGSDADLTIIDPQYEWTIDEAQLHSKNRVSIWHGTRCVGSPVATVLRGQIVMRNRHVIGSPRGAFIPRAAPNGNGTSARAP
jgi:dihydroorotase